MLRLGGEVDGAPENIENTAVHFLANFAAEARIERLRIAATQFGYLVNSQQFEIGCDGGSNAWNALEVSRRSGFHV